MNVSPRIILCIILVTGFVLSAGCASLPSAGGAATATRTPAQTEVTTVPLPVASPGDTPVPATTTGPFGTTPSLTPSTTATWIPKSSGESAADDPQIVLLQFAKGYFNAEIPDCGMRMAFPQVANNTGYGIVEPHTTLTAFSANEMISFLKANAREYASDPRDVDPAITNYIDPNTLGGAQCAGVPASPTWNFVRIDATIMPRNGRPADYDIGISVRSKGKVTAQLKLSRTLTIDKPVTYELYVPLKMIEMDRFDSIEMVFYKKA